MFNVFGPLTKYLKLDRVTIDNNVFRLHYKVSLMILICGCILTTSRQYIGDPIDCISDGVPGGIMDTYCWIHSTFSIPSKWVGKQGMDNAHPGVAPINAEGEPKYHKYYQWVCFVLFFQAILFYIPRYIWKYNEGGRLAMLVSDMREPIIVIDKNMRSDRLRIITHYFKQNQGKHFLYAAKFFACEFLNLINVVGQMYFVDRFLGYEFSTYGMDAIKFSEMEARDRADPMAVVFPKVTKCTFHKYGPSGTIQVHDGLCVLPLNIINEKIYVAMWLWFVVLSSITGLFLLYRLATIVGPGIRIALLQARTARGPSPRGPEMRQKIEDLIEAPHLNYRQRLGDFFLLYLVAKNVDEVSMKELILALHAELKPVSTENSTMPLTENAPSAPIQDTEV